MGKQINYAIDYESFVKVAQKALDLGCTIIRARAAEPQTPCSDLSVLDPSCLDYYFCTPNHAPIHYERMKDGSYCIDYDLPASISLIEAGYAPIHDDKKIGGNRMYIATGYYDSNDQWVPRSDDATRIYDALARLAGKLAPYHTFMLNNGKSVKERISPHFMNLIENEGYQLQIICRHNENIRRTADAESPEIRMRKMKDPANYRPASDNSAKNQLTAALGQEAADFLAAFGAIVFTPPEKK